MLGCGIAWHQMRMRSIGFHAMFCACGDAEVHELDREEEAPELAAKGGAPEAVGST